MGIGKFQPPPQNRYPWTDR